MRYKTLLDPVHIGLMVGRSLLYRPNAVIHSCWMSMIATALFCPSDSILQFLILFWLFIYASLSTMLPKLWRGCYECLFLGLNTGSHNSPCLLQLIGKKVFGFRLRVVIIYGYKHSYLEGYSMLCQFNWTEDLSFLLGPMAPTQMWALEQVSSTQYGFLLVEYASHPAREWFVWHVS